MVGLLDRIMAAILDIAPEYFERKRKNNPIQFQEAVRIGDSDIYNLGDSNGHNGKFRCNSIGKPGQIIYNAEGGFSLTKNAREKINWYLTKQKLLGLYIDTYAIIHDETINADERRVTIRPLYFY